MAAALNHTPGDTTRSRHQPTGKPFRVVDGVQILRQGQKDFLSYIVDLVWRQAMPHRYGVHQARIARYQLSPRAGVTLDTTAHKAGGGRLLLM